MLSCTGGTPCHRCRGMGETLMWASFARAQSRHPCIVWGDTTAPQQQHDPRQGKVTRAHDLTLDAHMVLTLDRHTDKVNGDRKTCPTNDTQMDRNRSGQSPRNRRCCYTTQGKPRAASKETLLHHN